MAAQLPAKGTLLGNGRYLTVENCDAQSLVSSASFKSEPTLSRMELTSETPIQVVSFEDWGLDEDLYGFAIKAFLRDTHAVENCDVSEGQEGGSRFGSLLRLLSAFCILWANLATQAALMVYTARYVTEKSVYNIRQAYDDFELHMYGNAPRHFVLGSDGYHRGLPEFFRPELFETLDSEVKEGACHIPLSQPRFLILILFIWTLTCLGELRRCVELFECLILHSKTAGTVVELVRDSAGMIYMRGVSTAAKAAMAVFILLPRAIITCSLLWLGCRWLVATNDSSTLVLNSVALAFIKDLKDLFYFTMVSAADKREVELTRIERQEGCRSQHTNSYVHVRALMWGLAALGVVAAYVLEFQQVLPAFQWDVAGVCSEWLAAQFLPAVHA